jgi:hypothetical protein
MRPILCGPAILACGALLACGAFLACGGGSGPVDSPPGPVGSFQCLDSAPEVDHVALRCGAQVAPDEWWIDVVVGVPTSSKDIHGFDFYLVFDPLHLAFVPGSEEKGNLLDQDGETVLLAAATATNPDDPGRLIVGISRAGGTGVQGLPGNERIMSFRIKALTVAPFGPVWPAFENEGVFDSSDQALPEILFRDQLLLSVE